MSTEKADCLVSCPWPSSRRPGRVNARTISITSPLRNVLFPKVIYHTQHCKVSIFFGDPCSLFLPVHPHFLVSMPPHGKTLAIRLRYVIRVAITIPDHLVLQCSLPFLKESRHTGVVLSSLGLDDMLFWISKKLSIKGLTVPQNKNSHKALSSHASAPWMQCSADNCQPIRGTSPWCVVDSVSRLMDVLCLCILMFVSRSQGIKNQQQGLFGRVRNRIRSSLLAIIIPAYYS